MLRRHSDAGVAHREGNHLVGPSRDLQRDPALLGELGCVAQEVEEGLAQLGQVGAHRADVLRTLELEDIPVLGHQRFHRGSHVARGLRDVDRFEKDRHAARFDLGKIEDVIDQLQQVLGRGKDLLQVGLHPLLPGVFRLLEQHLAVADDGIHRGAQLMAHVGQESALRLARLQRLSPRLFSIFDRAFQIGGAVGHRLFEIRIPRGEAGLALADFVGHAGEGPPEVAHLIAALQEGRELPAGHLPRLQFRRRDG